VATDTIERLHHIRRELAISRNEFREKPLKDVKSAQFTQTLVWVTYRDEAPQRLSFNKVDL